MVKKILYARLFILSGLKDDKMLNLGLDIWTNWHMIDEFLDYLFLVVEKSCRILVLEHCVILIPRDYEEPEISLDSWFDHWQLIEMCIIGLICRFTECIFCLFLDYDILYSSDSISINSSAHSSTRHVMTLFNKRHKKFLTSFILG